MVSVVPAVSAFHACACLAAPAQSPWMDSALHGSILCLISTSAGGMPDRNLALQHPIAAPPAVLDGAASERLQARSLLLAGQAGLCCNPGCAAHRNGPPYALAFPVDWLPPHFQYTKPWLL